MMIRNASAMPERGASPAGGGVTPTYRFRTPSEPHLPVGGDPAASPTDSLLNTSPDLPTAFRRGTPTYRLRSSQRSPHHPKCAPSSQASLPSARPSAITFRAPLALQLPHLACLVPPAAASCALSRRPLARGAQSLPPVLRCRRAPSLAPPAVIAPSSPNASPPSSPKAPCALLSISSEPTRPSPVETPLRVPLRGTPPGRRERPAYSFRRAQPLGGYGLRHAGGERHGRRVVDADPVSDDPSPPILSPASASSTHTLAPAVPRPLPAERGNDRGQVPLAGNRSDGDRDASGNAGVKAEHTCGLRPALTPARWTGLLRRRSSSGGLRASTAPPR